MRAATWLALILAAGVSGCANFGDSLSAGAKPADENAAFAALFGAAPPEGASAEVASPETRETAPAKTSSGLFDFLSLSKNQESAPPAAPAPANPPAVAPIAPKPGEVMLGAAGPGGVQLAAAAVPTKEDLLARLKATGDPDPTEYARWEKIVQDTPEAEWPLVALQLQAVLNYKSFQAAREREKRESGVGSQESEKSASVEASARRDTGAGQESANGSPEPEVRSQEEEKKQEKKRAKDKPDEPAKPEAASASAEGSKPDVLPPPSDDKPPQPLETSSATESESAGPPGEWREHLDRAIAALEAELRNSVPDEPAAVGASLPKPMTEEQFRAQAEQDRRRAAQEAQLRLLYLAAQRNADAVRAIEAFPPAEQEFWKHQVHGLGVFLDEQGVPVPDRRARLALRELREGLHHLAAASGLDVRNVAFCQQVFSFGSYVEFAPYEFRPNQEVLLYAEIDNFHAESRPDGFETELQGSYQVFDAAGRRVAEHVFPAEKEVCRQRRRDYFVPFRMYMPRQIAPGPYTLQLTVEDLKGRKFGQASVRFTIIP